MILIAILCGIFWAMGGNTLSAWLNKKFKWNLHFDSLWRKLGVPFVVCVGCLIQNPTWWGVLQSAAVFGALFGTIAASGYGENSVIYKFIRSITKNDGYLTNFITRTINGLMWTICGVLMLGGFDITLAYVLIGALLIGLIGAGCTVAVVSELLTGFVIGLMVLLKKKGGKK